MQTIIDLALGLTQADDYCQSIEDTVFTIDCDTSYNGWPIVYCHPEQLCLSTRRGFALSTERTLVRRIFRFTQARTHSGVASL